MSVSRRLRFSIGTLSLVVLTAASWAVGSKASRLPIHSLALGDTVVLFGPQQFNSLGHVVTHVEVFNLTLVPGRQYRMKIQNGEANGTKRPDTVAVYLNQGLVANTADLQGQASILRVVEPRDSNVLQVVIGKHNNDFIKVTLLSEPSSSYNIVGPLNYTIPGGGSLADTQVFALPASAKPPYRVHILNGTGASGNGVTGDSIKLNGATIVSNNELEPAIRSLVKQISLQSQNTLIVRLGGAAQVPFSLRITATDSTAPAITVTTPTVGLVTRDTLLAVSGAASRSGMRPLREDGIRLIRAGLTTPEEVLRVTRG